jgi:hypothetical protein
MLCLALQWKEHRTFGDQPQIFAFIQPEGHLLTRWIDGRHWDAKEYRTPEHVRLLTRMVKRIHALPPTGASFSPFRRVESYLQTALNFRVALPSGFDSILTTMHSVQIDQQKDPSNWLG